MQRKGLARGHIVVFDALLKLRQVCCDPRLVKMEAARKTKGSAKLDLLMELLPGLVEDGQRVLLFSQLTSMVSLIDGVLQPTGIDHGQLTGQTQDRETPIRRFQDGEVPLFLISLKAGGTGLNLPPADTFIHYDRQWNPAVMRQATDRAHRIGAMRTWAPPCSAAPKGMRPHSTWMIRKRCLRRWRKRAMRIRCVLTNTEAR